MNFLKLTRILKEYGTFHMPEVKEQPCYLLYPKHITTIYTTEHENREVTAVEYAGKTIYVIENIEEVRQKLEEILSYNRNNQEND